MTTPKPCPFCGARDPYFKTFDGSPYPPQWGFIRCDACSADGPAATNKKKAIQIWNERHA